MDKYNLWRLFQISGDINHYMSYKKKMLNPIDDDMDYADLNIKNNENNSII